MKLSGPGNSSDLEAAREIARRLHERVRRGERPAGRPPLGVPARRSSPPEVGVRFGGGRAAQPVARSPQARRARPLAAPASVPMPSPSRPSLDAAPELPPEPALPPDEPAPPSWDKEGIAPALGGAVDDLSELADAPGIDAIGPAPDEEPGIEIEDPGATLEEMVEPAGLPSVEEIVRSAGLADHDVTVEDGSYEPPPEAESVPGEAESPFEEPTPVESVSEELFDLPTTPSWDEVVDNCVTIAQARGAMLIDHEGSVLAARGYWPDPGAEAIATKLVAMMDKTLKDAPTRSVSAPVGTLHLTAWRVPLAEGVVTTAFLAEGPLHAEVRTPVDAEILRGAP